MWGKSMRAEGAVSAKALGWEWAKGTRGLLGGSEASGTWWGFQIML